MVAMQASGEPANFETATTPVKRHDTLYFIDEPVIFQVENTLFRVHRHIFQKSNIFNTLFTLPPGAGTQAEGLSDENPIHLSGLRSIDFERFLTIYYPKNIGTSDLSSVTDWTSVLAVATHFDFEECRAHAISHLTQIGDPIDHILLGRQHDVKPWLGPAYRALCMRNDPLSLEDGQRLGMRDVILISDIRQAIRGTPQIAVQERAVMLQINGRLV